MKAVAKHPFPGLAGETFYAFASRHGASRNVIRFQVRKLEAAAFDDVASAVDLLQDHKKCAAGRYVFA
ncbi:hypothetical protein [Bradyrhizobium lablabi]|uniref:hypothetical protein n=1 Tax=Bradyrhizobium lablabi TaxID=722472 RepID=UPI001BACFCD4|nr:hypothetical protein [Bradyrhizobium lablabi]MBR0696603.1 hypothetical protein [Bradyrhizobium lablabi]